MANTKHFLWTHFYEATFATARRQLKGRELQQFSPRIEAVDALTWRPYEQVSELVMRQLSFYLLLGDGKVCGSVVVFSLFRHSSLDFCDISLVDRRLTISAAVRCSGYQLFRLNIVF
jgi:hypothetical protein